MRGAEREGSYAKGEQQEERVKATSSVKNKGFVCNRKEVRGRPEVAWCNSLRRSKGVEKSASPKLLTMIFDEDQGGEVFFLL